MALVLLGAPANSQEQSSDNWITMTTDRSVQEAVGALTDAIEGAGATVMATVDHSQNAQSAGLELPATTLVIFGNPKIGTPLMQENRRVAIDLPQKILIWDEDGQTTIGYLAPEALAKRHGLATDSESIKTMTGALDKLSSAAAGEQ
ncbi:hypothetical protein FP2506_03499 [Fulvimarina pelagi HTCC2506]|uniref:DUF302 domain-containing protein n=1 Tax=Fulvimarina pelagi HTCC2506 TaxID=314231 RepID=Q0G033_9HYPH|nr:hypothetical protein FP2506_03499 [Fulvimarina pelagi HTCC2506]